MYILTATLTCKSIIQKFLLIIFIGEGLLVLNQTKAESLDINNGDVAVDDVLASTTPVETSPEELTTLNGSEEGNDSASSSSSTEKAQETPTQEPSQQESPKPEQTTNNQNAVTDGADKTTEVVDNTEEVPTTSGANGIAISAALLVLSIQRLIA